MITRKERLRILHLVNGYAKAEKEQQRVYAEAVNAAPELRNAAFLAHRAADQIADAAYGALCDYLLEMTED